ncbi:MAG: hypothetical protein ACR2NP_11385 [Pirellulaceae bacterium]
MDESTRLLLLTFLWIDLAILVFAGVVMIVCLPKRIRRAIRKNVQRLDGTISTRRRATERWYFANFLANSLGGVLLCLLMANAVVYVVHTTIVPLPLAAQAISQFNVDKATWAENLQNPAHGDIAGQFEAWQMSDGIRAGFDLFGLVTTWPVVLLLGTFIGIVGFLALGHRYIKYLQYYEAEVGKRYQTYFTHDMQTRHELVERQFGA